MNKEELKPIDVSKYTVTESGNVIKGEEKETTNKELEKRAFAEADKVVIGKGMDKSSVVHLRHLLKNMYVNGAISETELLSQHILELQADKGRLTDRVKELEAQNEEMKCCSNCKNEGDYKEPYRYGTGWCNICKRHKVAKGNLDKWKIKEK